jgi:8-oxo-dGTP pyrophosphatase MutT (NUDIX family)
MTHLISRGWDIPGGHVEPGEYPEETVRREVYEETGATPGQLYLLGYQRLQLLRPRPQPIPIPTPTVIRHSTWHRWRPLMISSRQQKREAVAYFHPSKLKLNHGYKATGTSMKRHC